MLILAGFLFAFIPLYPKLPLADLLPGYIVRLRLEDIFVGIAILIYGFQVLRKKAQWKTPFTWLIMGYALVGLASTLSGMYITQTIPIQPVHIGKSILHYLRYLEYFSLFFIAYSAIKSKKHFQLMLVIFVLTIIGISIYGYGQKYFYWPLYSTMNREFSKGMRLYLTEHARVQSTFGGHYDLGGYLTIALPMILAFCFSTKKWKYRVPLFISYIAGLWLLIMSASRASFGGFAVGVVLLIALFALQQPSLGKKVWWAISRGFITVFIISYMFLTYGESIFERFLQLLQPYPAVMEVYHDINDTRQNLMTGNFSNIVKRFTTDMIPEVKPPENGIAVTKESQDASQVLVTSDTQPSALPPDVTERIPEPVVVISTDSSGMASSSVVQKERTYSDNALKYGLSMAIRLDTLWPQAIRGFQRNPLVGSGYATLTKANINDFTEADSTDNNFLRTLGETGLLGFVTFYGTVVVGMFIAGKVLSHNTSSFAKSIAVGFIAGSVALLVNAIYIDVYASSKVAFTYWALTGFVLSYLVRELAESKMRPELPDNKVENVVLPKPKQ